MEASTRISEDERARLIQFLRDLRILLVRLLAREPALLSPRTLRLLEAAWQEIEREGRFYEAIKWIENGEYDRYLVDHGLYGEQLKLKVGVFEFADQAVQEDEGRLFRFFKRRKGLMAWALKAGNVVLGSLASVIPGSGAIQEFKDAAEAALDENVGIRQRISSSFNRWRGREVEEAREPPEPMRLGGR